MLPCRQIAGAPLSRQHGSGQRYGSASWKEYSAGQLLRNGEARHNSKKATSTRDGSSRYEYKSWRTSVYKRDNFTCQKCFAHGVPLAAHHIFSWAEYPALRYEQSNGITLCEDCHDKIHGKSKKPKTFACIDCGIKKTSGRSPRCYSCGAKARWLKK